MNLRNQRGMVFFIASAFFLSGGCGLVYEVLWTRYLADLTGATSLSQFVVLMVFMGGLALGAVLVGRLVDRGGNGLTFYGWLEVAIGLYAVLFPFLFSKVADIFILVGSNLEPGSWTLLILKLLISSLLIALPSVAMGGTLPAVTRYLTSSEAGLRRNISLLYGLNSLGAVLGILFGGFILVYRYGLSGSMLYTGVINIALGILVLGVDRLREHKTPAVAEEDLPVTESLDSHIYKTYTAHRAILIAGLSGFAAMALQIAWIRYFVIVLGATNSAFTVVVAAFIFGLGLGALLVRSKWIGRFPLPAVLAWVFAVICVAMGISLFFYGRIPFEIGRFLAIIARISYAWPFYQIMKFGICFTLMLLPTVASGMILPLCVRIAGRSSDRVGRDVALVYGVNTLGSLLGIFIASQVLFRTLTLPRTLQFIMLIYLAATIFLAFILKERGRKRILALSVVLLVTHLAFWKPWSPEELSIGNINFGLTPPYKYEHFIERNKHYELVEERQGADVQATVLEVDSSPTDYLVLLINGKPDASSDIKGPDMPTQVLLAHLPMLLHPAPKNAFVLGVGSGITSGEILKFPEVEKVVTVELASEVLEASKNFADYNGRFWENPKHRMVIDDGKTFLRLNKEKFDVISMEPTNVWQKGMAGLFNEEFFRLVKSRLSPGGVVVQWLHSSNLDDLSFNIILKTFSLVFPEASLFKVDSRARVGDFLIVGYDEQWRFDPQNLGDRFYQPQIKELQKKIGNANPAGLLLREVLDRDSFRRYTTALTTPINTENFPVLEQAAEYSLFMRKPITFMDGDDSRINPDAKDMLINIFFNRVGLDPAQLKAVTDLMKPGENDKLRNSLNLMLIDELWPETPGPSPQEISQYIADQQLLGTVTHPYYRLHPTAIPVNEAYNLLSNELLLWNKAASQIWTPRPERLQQLYDRVTAGLGREASARLALDIAVSLVGGTACKAALPFLRIVEEKGGVALERMEPIDIISSFYCEAKVGDAQKALAWWNLIEQNKIPVTEFLLSEKVILDIRLGGDPPPPVYGRLPSRW